MNGPMSARKGSSSAVRNTIPLSYMFAEKQIKDQQLRASHRCMF